MGIVWKDPINVDEHVALVHGTVSRLLSSMDQIMRLRFSNTKTNKTIEQIFCSSITRAATGEWYQHSQQKCRHSLCNKTLQTLVATAGFACDLRFCAENRILMTMMIYSVQNNHIYAPKLAAHSQIPIQLAQHFRSARNDTTRDAGCFKTQRTIFHVFCFVGLYWFFIHFQKA